jgi:hypothetical protein
MIIAQRRDYTLKTKALQLDGVLAWQVQYKSSKFVVTKTQLQT